ncbi:hypothetical protein E2562_012604 [Oryza meyeriana var. granulata]|uniref:Uncharacterized protein n=1 Tax=Oryza meyeriana var. granulata TaxID=110450 RepID=A0A6G1CGK3_9ORYZ|nr:hypothetical protein E2562_012604 [Oryza meyeriana var. granulata]
MADMLPGDEDLLAIWELIQEPNIIQPGMWGNPHMEDDHQDDPDHDDQVDNHHEGGGQNMQEDVPPHQQAQQP